MTISERKAKDLHDEIAALRERSQAESRLESAICSAVLFLLKQYFAQKDTTHADK